MTTNTVDDARLPDAMDVSRGVAAMSAHTPGPWAWNKVTGRVVSYSNDFRAEEQIAHLLELAQTISNRREDANARLIVAAPELLEALMKLAEHADGWCPSKAHSDEWTEHRLLLDIARQAIRRATGESA